jgi:putative ABC transport system substrate-binding protein
MTKKLLIWSLATIFLTTVSLAEGQQRKKVYRIGYLSTNSDQPRIDAFRQGLRDRGWVEGVTIDIEYRIADAQIDRLPDLAAELIRLKVDVIFAMSENAAQAAKKATRTLPIVSVSGDPVGTGLVDSLARPGGNVTGLANFTSELGGKRLELLKEAIPKISRVAVLWNPEAPGAARRMKEIESVAPFLRIKLQPVAVRGRNDFEQAFSAMKKARAGAFFPLRTGIIQNQLKRIVELAAKNRMPAMYDAREFPEAGGLMSYGTVLVDLDRRAATFVDKILKGTMPADLPVEQPMKFELIINLIAAKQIGLTIPPNFLVRADKVIR